MVTDLGKHFDAIVVGSGAAGSIAVKELTEQGMDVLLLEAGRDMSKEDFAQSSDPNPSPLNIGVWPRVKAALHGQPVQARRAFYSRSMDKFLVNDRENPYTTPRDAWYLWIRGRCLGGRLNSYGRMLLRMSEYDFKGRSYDGRGADWPITASDISPWYEYVEKFIGIYGQADGLEQVPDGVYLGESKLTEAEQAFRATVQDRWPERRIIAWRYQAPNPGAVPQGIVAARKTGRLTTRTDAVVREITVDGHGGRATGAVFVDRLNKRECHAAADVVVLCASAIESIRLLLNSRSPKHPNGLGNSSGLLGRYFMDQAPSLTFGYIPDRYGYEADDTGSKDSYKDAAGGVYIPRFDNLRGQPQAEFARGIAFQGSIGGIPAPDDQPAAFALMGYGEMLPRYENSVGVNAARTDAWGVPVAHIRCVPGENEHRLMIAQVDAAKQMTEAAGYRLNFTGSALGLATNKPFPQADPFSRLAFRVGFKRTIAMGTAIHECGGVRMGSDPADSLLNEFNQSWEVPNLFVTDGSAFVSSGLVGPTLTIMALTARACQYIVREHAGGAL